MKVILFDLPTQNCELSYKIVVLANIVNQKLVLVSQGIIAEEILVLDILILKFTEKEEGKYLFFKSIIHNT